MSDLQKLSDDELQAELSRRKDVQRRSGKPHMLQNPNYKILRSTCQEHIDQLYDKQWVNDDMSHYIFEAAMMALFGADVWDWINKQ